MLSNLLLGTKLKDMTSGFELFSRAALEEVLAKGVHSRGHFFQTEIKAHCQHLRFTEVPIHYRAASDSVNNNVLKEAERLVEKLKGEGKDVDLYATGRKGEAYFKFRQRPIVQAWTGFSDQPTYDKAAEIGKALIEAFLKEQGEEGDVDEVAGAAAAAGRRSGSADACEAPIVRSELQTPW